MTKTAHIPKGWKKTEIESVCDVNKTSINPQKEPDRDFNYIDISSIQDFQISDYKTLKGSECPSRARRLVKKNDCIVSTVRPNLRSFSFVSDEYNRFVCSTGFCVLSPQIDIISPSFLFQTVKSNQFAEYLVGKTTGSNYPAVNAKNVYSYTISLPPLPEQQRIADILSRVDEEIEKVDQIIEMTEKLKKGLMQQLLTKGIGHTKFKKTKLGEIPEGWEVTTLNDVCKCVIDCKNRTPKYFEDGEYFVVRTPNVRDGKLRLSEALHTDKDHYNEWTKRGVPEANDLLITREAPAGEFCLIPEDIKLCLGQRMMLARADLTCITPEMLLYWFQSPIMQRYIQAISTGSTVKHLKVGQIKNLPVLMPSIKEQKQLTSILQEVDNKSSYYQSLKTKLLALKQGLMQDLLSGRVRIPVISKK